MNVRSRGGQLGQAGLRGPPPFFVPPLGPPRVYLTTIPHTQPPVFPHFLFLPRSRRPPGTGRGGFATRLEETKEVVGGSPRRRAEEEGRGLGLSLDQYSHLLPAGPGRTSRSEAHLLADIKPPYLRTILHPPPPRLVHPSSFLSSRRGLLAGRSARYPLAICIRRDELRLSQKRKFFVPLRRRSCNFVMDSNVVLTKCKIVSINNE